MFNIIHGIIYNMNPEKVGNFIKKLRKDNNLTQKDLALKYGVTYQAVSKWENGNNLPDVTLLRQMSKDFNVSILELLDGEKSKSNKKKYIIIFISVIIVLLLSFLIYKQFDKGETFSFKTISTNCSDFDVSGSIAYDNSKTSIYISNITYCGNEDNTTYKLLECKLYEVAGDTKVLISNKSYNNMTLEDFLKQVTFTYEHFSESCKMHKDGGLVLEIEATDSVNTKYFKIPLEYKDC